MNKIGCPADNRKIVSPETTVKSAGTDTRISETFAELGYKTIIDLLPSYISIQDHSLRILFVNQTFKNDFGNGVGELCHVVYKKSEERCANCPVQKTFSDKRVHLSEETVRLSNGEFSQVIVYSAPITDISGNVVAVMEMATNITRVKEMQKELAILGQSFAMLSHDIKNILEGLQGGAYVVDEGLKDKDPELTRKGWEVVKKNITEISIVVQNILYSAKKRKPRHERVSPDSLAREVVYLLEEKAKSLNVQLRCSCNPSLPQVLVDPASIKRMLCNLIGNAIEACKLDKEKDTHTVTVRADFYDRTHFAFEVEDDGVGMDECTKSNLFKGFFSTKGCNGTGLGLLVVDKIIKEHGGRIEVLTTPGKGSTFRVIFKIQ